MKDKRRYYVKYRVRGYDREQKAGPYASYVIAADEERDISGYEGVYDSRIESEGGAMSRPMLPDDQAYWMLQRGLEDPSKRSKKTVHQEGCFICEDPEFALMGLPLCYPCESCGGHVPADDTVCTDCGHDNLPEEVLP